ncbi:MAG: cysteine-rich KTR domain-containing protein [Anaeroplasmataceae bacterium]
MIIHDRKWIFCPFCENKTRTMIQDNTILKNYPLYCPKCKKEVLVNFENNNVQIIKEPDTLLQSQ